MTGHYVVLFEKSGCHLCALAEQMLMGMAQEFDFYLDKVDISAHPALQRLYGTLIPVVIIDWRTMLSAPIHSRAVRAALSGQTA